MSPYFIMNNRIEEFKPYFAISLQLEIRRHVDIKKGKIEVYW